jgi:hypothetical protein
VPRIWLTFVIDLPLPALGRCSNADTLAARSGSAARVSRAVTE